MPTGNEAIVLDAIEWHFNNMTTTFPKVFSDAEAPAGAYERAYFKGRLFWGPDFTYALDRELYNGFYQVTFVSRPPRGSGQEGGGVWYQEQVAVVTTHFRRKTAITRNGLEIVIPRTPTPGPRLSTPAGIEIPITIPFRCRASV